MIWLLALRNIVRNKKDSLIIMLLIAVITFLFFSGNTILSQSEYGLHKSYAESLTGDIVIEKKAEVTMSLFGANAPHLEEFFAIEPLPAYNDLIKIVESSPDIEMFTSQVSTTSYIEIGNKRSGAIICGIDAKNYFSLFPGITLKEGRFLTDGEYGAMITEERAANIKKASGENVRIGDEVLLTSAGEAGFKMRKIPLVGIYSYHNAGTAMKEIVLVDAQTARVLSAIQVAGANIDPDPDEDAFLNGSDIDDLFWGSDPSLEDDTVGDAGSDKLLDTLYEKLNQEKKAETAESGGDWNFIIIKVLPDKNPVKLIKELNILLAPYGAEAVDWRIAAGISAILVLLLQALYNAGIAIVCVAGIIAIVNILLISVFRRTREIGTLRAIGAQDNYIRFLLIGENCSLGLIGGIMGIVFGFVIFTIINAINITIHNDLLASLLGGAVLHIDFYWGIAFVSILFSVVLSFLSLILPAEAAVRIDPVRAVREG